MKRWLIGGIVGLLVALGCSAVVANENIFVISDVTNWHHPTKDVLKKWKIELTKVELANNRTFPIFYLQGFPFDTMGWDNAKSMAGLEAELFFANGKHDYALEIAPENIRVTVRYDRQKRMLIEEIEGK